jgi:Mg2+ and Co2+ transporter CorA
VVHDETDLQLLSEDPFFLIASLFTTSALSFVQLLNYLSVSIAECRSTESALLDVKLERLRHCVSIIYRVEFALAENLRWIARGGCSTWPRAQPGTDTAVRKEALQTTLQTDHEALQQRCVIMRRDCESATMFLVSYSQLQCAERGIAQASEIQRLTKLASFFVPLASVTSAFGMNVKELQQHFPSIWVFSATAVVISVATYAAMFWSEVWDWSSSTWRKLRAKATRDRKRRWTEA